MIRRIRPPLLLALATVLVCWKPIFHREFTLLAGSDMARAYFPYFDAAAYWFKRGVLLLWDPYVYAGKPNMGEPQPGLYYPLNWIFFLLPSPDGGINLEGMQALLILDFFLAVASTYALARSCGLTGRGAGVAAIAFAFGGYTVQLYGYVNLLSGFVWMPLALLCFRNGLQAGGAAARARWVASSAVVIALTFLPGHHVPAVHTGLLLASYAAFQILYRWREMSARGALAILAALAAVAAGAALLTALQWVPSAEWARYVYRWVGEGPPLVWGDRVPHAVLERTGNLSPQNALSFLLPYISTNVNLYIGPAVAFLAIAGLLYGRRRDAHFFAAAAIVYFFLSWGRFSALHGWLNTLVPGVWFAREVFNYLVPLQLCLAMLAGFGADRIASAFGDAPNPSVRLFVKHGAWASALVGFGALALAGTLYLTQGGPLDHPHLTGLGGLTAYALVFAFLLFLLLGERITGARFQILVLALILVDLTSQFSASVPTKIRPLGATNTYVGSFWNMPPAAEFLAERRTDEFFRVADPSGVFPRNFGDVWRIEATMGHGVTALIDYFALRGTGWGPASNASALLNVRYFPSPVPIPGMKKVFDDGVAVYENSRAVPRFFLASRSSIFADKEELLRWLGSPLFDLRETALLLESDAALLPEEIRGPRDLLDLDVVGLRTGAQKRGETLADPEQRAQLEIYQPAWGHSTGDEVTIALRPQEALRHCFFAVDYLPPPSTPGRLTVRVADSAGEREIPITMESAAGSEPRRTVVDLGPLEATEFHLHLERTAACNAAIERISISSEPPEPRAEAGSVDVLSYTPNRIVLSSEARRPALLVASEVYYPGWEAWVDGVPVPLVRADHILRGVAVPAGRHTVEMRFRSKTFLAGLSISAAATLMIGAFLAFTWRTKVRAQQPAGEEQIRSDF